METGSPERDRERLPEEARQAISFANKVYTSLDFDWQEKAKTIPVDVLNRWRHNLFVTCEAFWLGVKPAVLIEHLKEVVSIQHDLDSAQRNAYIYKNEMIVDRDLVLQRIADEPDFARDLGWQEGMTVDDWLAQASPGGDGRQRSIMGFFLGYPKSAVTAYGNKQITKPVGVSIEGPHGGKAFSFTTDAELVDADDVKALTQKTRSAFIKVGLGKFLREKD